MRKEFVNRGISTIPIEKYVTDISDPYVQAFVDSMSIDFMSFIDLDEIFVEFFLRTRISLKDLQIKETRYGEQLRSQVKAIAFTTEFRLMFLIICEVNIINLPNTSIHSYIVEIFHKGSIQHTIRA